MNLYDAIYQLVCENDCVIIPGFGGFVMNRFPANVDFSKQEFYPPSRKVAFNENLSISDGLLVNYLSHAENISWAEADMAVKSFVDDLNRQLADGITVAFDGIGEFSRRTGNLVFVSNANNLLDESFGLPTFNFPMLHSASKPRIESAIIKGNPDKNGKKNRRGRAVAWSLSAVAVIAGLVCMSLYMGWFDHLFGSEDENTVFAGFGVGNNTTQVVETEEPVVETITAETADIAAEDVSMDADEIVPEETIAEAEVEPVAEETIVAEVAEPEVVVPEPAESEYRVHIIAGCFANYSNAENVYKDLSSRGLSPQILPLHKGLYKVSVKGFANTTDACAELQSLKELTGNDQLWVMKM
ncbi:MAG: SPOR domain-containing protein [Bacteroidales bacterium]|nr:SPOR domain-containing protein [Bacteroidales bacterium]